jgi:hypothetical protein
MTEQQFNIIVFYCIVGALLVICIIMYILYRRELKREHIELEDLTRCKAELNETPFDRKRREWKEKKAKSKRKDND